MKVCKQCTEKFREKKDKQKFCSLPCYHLFITGKKLSPEHRLKVVAAILRQPPRSEQTKNKMSLAAKAQNRLMFPGSKNVNWKGGVSKLPGYMVAQVKKRRAWKKGSHGHITNQQWEELKKYYGNKCLCCVKPESISPLTQDHIIPLKLGGIHDITNIQPLCRSCNSKKHLKVTDYRGAYGT